ncbi:MULTISPECIES: 2-phospho-L-lactate guanylyltransferase [unclassified Phenylobacterium]|uniref:2-phospho-L-lactate guanylyltransferase n=1 Tax=unclassified Phenylobacterium TaxID=2640670 RepID=UPI00083B2B14|nr:MULTISPECIES: 2-phospho-L-lactate guanylyltransferase [unclassified Phenylobacterium]
MNADVLIAARGGQAAKSRLAGRLDHDQRDALVEAMLADMLAALAACPAVLRTHVTTPTPALARLAARSGAVVYLEREDGDLNGAFERARRRIAAVDPDTTLVLLPGDLPRLEADDVEQCLEGVAPDRLVLAPASADGGTGALALAAGIRLPLAFGPGSFGKHLAAARTLGLTTRVVQAPGLGLDLDRPSDLDTFLALTGRSRTADLLRGWRAAA